MARLIDADKVFERADEVTFMGFRSEERKKHFMDLVSEIMKQSTVDTKPVVRGRWEWWETMGITFARCSVCDGPIEGDAVVSFAFCPYCGADMRESKED